MTPGNEGDRGWVLEGMTEDVLWITPPDDPDPATSKRSAQLHETTTATWRPHLAGLGIVGRGQTRHGATGIAARNSEASQWVLNHMSADVEWIAPERDPFPRTYKGYEGVQEFWSRWRNAVGQLKFAPEETIDGGEDVVVAHRWARNDITGLQISDKIAQVFTFNEEDVRPRPGVPRPRRGAQSCRR